MGKLCREDLVDLVRRIMNAEGTEAEVDLMIQTLCENVPYPGFTDLIYYADQPLTPEQVVDKALSYRPIRL